LEKKFVEKIKACIVSTQIRTECNVCKISYCLDKFLQHIFRVLDHWILGEIL